MQKTYNILILLSIFDKYLFSLQIFVSQIQEYTQLTQDHKNIINNYCVKATQQLDTALKIDQQAKESNQAEINKLQELIKQQSDLNALLAKAKQDYQMSDQLVQQKIEQIDEEISLLKDQIKQRQQIIDDCKQQIQLNKDYINNETTIQEEKIYQILQQKLGVDFEVDEKSFTVIVKQQPIVKVYISQDDITQIEQLIDNEEIKEYIEDLRQHQDFSIFLQQITQIL